MPRFPHICLYLSAFASVFTPQSQTGWHLSDLNPTIVKHREAWLGGRKGLRVFFPLCGKTQDMVHFARDGYSVLGFEAVDQAIGTHYKIESQQSQCGTSSLHRHSQEMLFFGIGSLFFIPYFLADFGSENGFAMRARHPLSVPPALRPFKVLDAVPCTEAAAARAREAGCDITVLQGDLFALPTLPGPGEAVDAAAEAELSAAGITGTVQAAFDRGSFVAIRPEKRKHYEKVRSRRI